jgi:hypothetical protein
LAGRPLVGQGNTVNFVEEDIDDGAKDSDSPARTASADSVSQILSTLSVSTGVAPVGQTKLHNFVTDSGRSAPAVDDSQSSRDPDSKSGVLNFSELVVSLGDAAMGTLRQLEANSDKVENEAKAAQVAREIAAARVDGGSNGIARADRQSVWRESGVQSGLQPSVSSSDAPVPHFPKAFARMESWGIPAEKTRRLSFVSRSPDVHAASGDDAVGTVVKVYGISTQKESEVELGVISLGASQHDGQSIGKESINKQDTSKQLSGAGRLDVVVPGSFP